MPRSKDELPDFSALIKRAVDADLDSSVFTEKDWDVAKNSIEFCTSHKYLNASDPLWPRQIEMLSRFFEDVCYFCSDADYVHNVPVDDTLQNVYDRFVFLEHGLCPKCKRNRTEMLDEWQKDPKFAQYTKLDSDITVRPVPPNEYIGIWGQRSGKSFSVASFFWPYILHRYLAVPNITSYFRLASNTVLEAAFVAPTKDQINTYMWTPFKNIFDGSPWFREYVSHLKAEEKKLGISMYHRQQTFMVFPTKRLAIYMKAANSGTLRGGTRIFGSCDELGWFSYDESGKKRAGVKDGTEVFTALNRSLRTVRSRANKRRKKFGDYNSLDAYMFCISSPSSVGDAIEQRAAIAHRSPRMFFNRYPTWEVNPEEDRDTIFEEEGADPIKFKRDYCAEPPRAASPFIEPSPQIRELISHEHTKKPLFTYDIKEEKEKETGLKLLRPIIKKKSPDKTTPRVITVDNGEKKNSFSVCMASYFPEHEGVLIEEFLEVAPSKDRPVDLGWCYDNLVLELVKAFNTPQVVYDRWESSYAVSDLRSNYHVDAIRYSLAWKDFRAFRDDLRGTRVWYPVPEREPDDLLNFQNLVERARYPRAHFITQLTTVNEFNKRVEKPDRGNDDLFRCAVLAHWAIMNHSDVYKKGSRRRRGGGHRSPIMAFSNRGRGSVRRRGTSRGSIPRGFR